MNLLLINYEFPPLGGGSASATANLARHLAAAGEAVTVLTGGYADLPSREEKDGYTLIRVPSPRRAVDRSTPFEMSGFAVAATLRAVTGRMRPDVAIAFFGFPSGPVAATLRLLRGTPYIVSLRGGDVPGHQPEQLARAHRLMRPLLTGVWRRAAGVVAPSDGLRRLAETSAPDVPVTVIPNGVDTDVFCPASKMGMRSRQPRLLYVGRVSEEKGLGDILPALCMVKDSAWTLDIVGDGPLRPDLERRVADAGLGGRVQFRGWRAREDMPEVYRHADIFIFPSRGEGLPNTVLEAMASALPVVAVRAMGTDEAVVHEETGYLVPMGDAGAFAARLAAVLADESLRDKLGQAGRQRAAQFFSWENGSQMYAEMCRAIVREPKPCKA